MFARCALNATADSIEVATNAMDGFLASITGGIDCLPSYVEVSVCDQITYKGFDTIIVLVSLRIVTYGTAQLQGNVRAHPRHVLYASHTHSGCVLYLAKKGVEVM